MGITAISLGLVALVLLGVKLFEGEQADQNANALSGSLSSESVGFAERIAGSCHSLARSCSFERTDRHAGTHGREL